MLPLESVQSTDIPNLKTTFEAIIELVIMHENNYIYQNIISYYFSIELQRFGSKLTEHNSICNSQIEVKIKVMLLC